MLTETQISDFWECYEVGAASLEEIAKYVSEVTKADFDAIFAAVKEYAKDNLTWDMPSAIVD